MVSKLKALGFSFFAFLTAIFTSAVTMTGGKLAWEASDKTAIEGGVANALGNIWSSIVMVLPYLGLAAGFFLVVALIMKLSRGRR